MNKYLALLRNDIRQVIKDPMLMASIIGPLLLLVIARYVFPMLDNELAHRYGIQLSAYEQFAASLFLIVIPLLPGTMAGLLMLDDRDENMIAYFQVTPLSRDGYFRYRLLLPSLLTLIMGGLFILFSGMAEAHPANSLTLLLLVLEAPMLALFLTSFASNKVEGLALSKASVVLFIGPIAADLAPVPWTYLGSLIPTYWTAQSYLSGISGHSAASMGWFAGGLAFHFLLILWLLRRFLNRMD